MLHPSTRKHTHMTSSFDWTSFTPTSMDLRDELPDGQRWSTWNDIPRTLSRGPQPWPDWVVTDWAAIDTDLGVVKTGKEADVVLIERAVTDGPSCLMAAKRYRHLDHRLFHRDADYTTGRRTRRSRDARAMAAKSRYGRAVAAGEWATAEFNHLKLLWTHHVPVPYPVQILGSEICMEWIGDADGSAAPRLASLRPAPDELADLSRQLLDAMAAIADLGFAHGDLSPYNVLVHDSRAVIIDIPQLVDLAANPRGPEFLERDCRNVTSWFSARGLACDADEWFADLIGRVW